MTFVSIEHDPGKIQIAVNRRIDFGAMPDLVVVGSGSCPSAPRKLPLLQQSPTTASQTIRRQG